MELKKIGAALLATALIALFKKKLGPAGVLGGIGSFIVLIVD